MPDVLIPLGHEVFMQAKTSFSRLTEEQRQRSADAPAAQPCVVVRSSFVLTQVF